MADNNRFRTPPRPDPEVVALLQSALRAALAGKAKSVAIVLVDQLNSVETKTAGDPSDIRTNALLAGLVRCAYRLLNDIREIQV